MSYEWQRSKGMPDFTRSGNDIGSGNNRMVWLLVVLVALGGIVLASSVSIAPSGSAGTSEPENVSQSAGAAASGG